LPVEKKQRLLEVKLTSGDDLIMADEVHFTNLINMLDNAVKYSRGEDLLIGLCTQNVNHH